ncbi:MAG: hypothetical protein NTW56_08720 [Alphaproteobacteria bacterium]|nr:hypothetical protein [Alphaproteobacteria bacterium]
MRGLALGLLLGAAASATAQALLPDRRMQPGERHLVQCAPPLWRNAPMAVMLHAESAGENMLLLRCEAR